MKKNSICATGPQNTNYLFSFADFNVRFLCVCFATLNSLSSDIRGATINKREGGESPLLRLSCFRIRRRVLIRCETLRRRRHMNEIGQGVDHPFSLSSRADDGGGGGEREGETRTVRRGEGRIARTRRRDRSTLVCPLSPWFSPIFLERVWWKSMMGWPFARRHRQIESGATLIERWRWLSERRRFILIRHPNCGQLMWEWKEIKKNRETTQLRTYYYYYFLLSALCKRTWSTDTRLKNSFVLTLPTRRNHSLLAKKKSKDNPFCSGSFRGRVSFIPLNKSNKEERTVEEKQTTTRHGALRWPC